MLTSTFKHNDRFVLQNIYKVLFNGFVFQCPSAVNFRKSFILFARIIYILLHFLSQSL